MPVNLFWIYLFIFLRAIMEITVTWTYSTTISLSRGIRPRSRITMSPSSIFLLCFWKLLGDTIWEGYACLNIAKRCLVSRGVGIACEVIHTKLEGGKKRKRRLWGVHCGSLYTSCTLQGRVESDSQHLPYLEGTQQHFWKPEKDVAGTSAACVLR